MVVFEEISNYLNLQKVLVKRGTSDNPWPWGMVRGETPRFELVMLDYSELDVLNAYDYTKDLPQIVHGYFGTLDEVIAYVETHPNTTIPANHSR